MRAPGRVDAGHFAGEPLDLIRAAEVVERLDRGRPPGTLSQAGSMIATLAASFGILTGA